MANTLHPSNRVPGRFALDEPSGQTLSTGHPIVLKLGKFAIPGHVETDVDTSYFIADGGTWKDRVELREGMIIKEQ